MSARRGSSAAASLPVTERGSKTRAKLLDSTLTLLASTGFAATTTQAVLEHSGISRGSLLHQFKTRDALMVGAALEAVARMYAQESARLDGISDPREALRQYPYVLWNVYNEGAARALMELELAARWDGELRKALRPAFKEIHTRVAHRIRKAAESYGLSDVEAAIVAVGALVSGIHGLALASSLMEQESQITAILDSLSAHYYQQIEGAA